MATSIVSSNGMADYQGYSANWDAWYDQDEDFREAYETASDCEMCDSNSSEDNENVEYYWEKISQAVTQLEKRYDIPRQPDSH